jgi:hypothetical protein
MKNKVIAIVVLVAVIATITAVIMNNKTNVLGNRINMAEVTLFTTSTNANFTGLPVVNVNDFDYVAYTIAGTASGTVKFLCSYQDNQITTGATSTSNRWDFVDVTNNQTEASIDGNTGVVITGGVISQYIIRNSGFKWCSAYLTGNTSPAGLGTTTVYLKKAQNQ